MTRFKPLKELAVVLGQVIRHVKPDFQELLLNPLAETVVQDISCEANGSKASADEITSLCVLLHECEIPNALGLMFDNKDRFSSENFMTGMRKLLVKNSGKCFGNRFYSWSGYNYNYGSSGSSSLSLYGKWIQEKSAITDDVGTSTVDGEKTTTSKTDEATLQFDYPRMVSTSIWPEFVLTAVSNFFMENVGAKSRTTDERQLKRNIEKMQRVKKDFIADAFLVMTMMMSRLTFDHDPYLMQLVHRVIAMPEMFPVESILIPVTKEIFQKFKPEPESLPASALLLLLDHEIEKMEPHAHKELGQKNDWSMDFPGCTRAQL